MIHYILCYIFLEVYQFDFYHTGLITSFTLFTNFIVIHLILTFDKSLKESWFFFDMNSFKGLWDYVKLAVPSAGICVIEYFGFEALGLMSSYISVDANAAMFLSLNIGIVLFMIPLGFSQAATSLVGQSIGKMNAVEAKNYTKFIFKLSLLFSACIASAIFLLRH